MRPGHWVVRPVLVACLVILSSVIGSERCWCDDESVQLKPQVALDAQGHTAWISRVFLDRYGSQLYTASHDKTIRVWDLNTYEPGRVIRPPIDSGLCGEIYAAGLNPAETFLAVSGHMAKDTANEHDVLVILMPDGEKLRRLPGNRGPVRDLAFSPDGQWLAAVGEDKVVRIWQTSDWQLAKQYTGHTDRVMDVDWAPDSSQLVTVSWDNTARIWNLADDTSITMSNASEHLLRVAWSHDGTTIATGGSDSRITLWDAAGRSPRTLTSLPNDVHTIAFSPDDKLILYGYGSRRNYVHGGGVIRIADRSTVVNLVGTTDTPMTGIFTPDGRRAILGDADGNVCIWSVADGRWLRRLHSVGGNIHGNGWSPDGRTVAFGYQLLPGETLPATTALERTFTIDQLDYGPRPDYTYHRAQSSLNGMSITTTSHRVASVQHYGRSVASYQIPFADERIRCRTLLPGNRAAVGCRYGTILFNANNGDPLYSLPGHVGTVFALSPSPNNKYLLSGGDQTLQIWSIDKYEHLLSMFFAGDEWIAWTPQGYYAASVAGESLMGWHVQRSEQEMPEYYPASRFHAEFYRPDVIRKLIDVGSVRIALNTADAARGRDNEPQTIKASLPPAVKLTVSQGQVNDAGETTFDITAMIQSANGEPIRAVRLIVDGRPGEEIRDATATSAQLSAKFTLTVPPGKHQLTVRAESAKSIGLSETVDVVATGKSDKLPRRFVLAIDTGTSEGNVTTIAKRLDQPGDTDFAEGLVHRVIGTQATRTAIVEGFDRLKQHMSGQDVAVVYLAGRVTHDEEKQLFLVTSDARAQDLAHTAIGASFLRERLQVIPGRIALVFDVTSTNTAGDQPLVYDLLRQLSTEEYGIATIGAIGEVATATKTESNGLLSQAMLAGLDEKADRDQNGMVDVKELAAFVKLHVKEASSGRQRVVTGHPELLRTFPIMRP